MKSIIWLDDMRDPKDYGVSNAIWYKTSQAFCTMCTDKTLTEEVTAIHFDNDLGEESYGEGYDCFTAVESGLFFGYFTQLKNIFVHTSNPSAAEKFMVAKDVFKEKYKIEIKRVNL